jgi:hypothetical protein
MKKLFGSIFYAFLSNYKWYRKKKGGKWYKIQEDDVSGFAAPGELWAQALPADYQFRLLKEENYNVS